MKRSYFLTAIIFLMAAQASPQISLTRADFPGIGNLVVTAEDNVTTINPGQAGAGQVWDFSNLVPSGYDSVYYISPAGAPGYQNYPDANIVTNHNPAQYPNGYNINFWNYSEAGLKGVADESLINLFGDFYFAFHITYLPPSANLDFPIGYGDHKSQDLVMNWITATRMGGAVIDSALTVSHMHLECLADAWGTMILPDGSFPVLRVKETFATIDSGFTWNGGWVYSSDTASSWTQYRWYANDFGEVGYYNPQSKKGSGSSFTFFKSETLVGLNEKRRQDDVVICPNPAASTVRVIGGGSFDRIEVLDNTGRIVLQPATPSFDVSSLASGVYTVRVLRGAGVSTSLLIRR